MEHRVITDYTNVNLENVHLKVYVRLRPPGDGSNAVDPRFIERFPDNARKIVLRDPGHHYGEYAFMFDHVFWTDTQQDQVFETVCKPQVDHILSGFNSCCFAYGQTGSGKTHTMFGDEGDKRGLIPRAIEYLCSRVEARRVSGGGETAIVVSFLEIYCDQIRDLGKSYLNLTEQQQPPAQQQQQQPEPQKLFLSSNGVTGAGGGHYASSPQLHYHQQTQQGGGGGGVGGGGGNNGRGPGGGGGNSGSMTTTSMSAGESLALTRKTSEIFTRLQMARQESFARVRSSDNNLGMSGSGMGGGGIGGSGSGGGGGPPGMASSGGLDGSYREDYQAMNLEIREDAEGNVFVKDLTLIPVTSVHEVMQVINEGLKIRATHETKMNSVSSRSHTVFTVTVMQRGAAGSEGEAVSGTLHLVDLAGSERLKKSDSQGLRLREAVHINSSLTALGKVVVALDPASERTHVPYRDSKLTRLLQNSIGGNSYTAVVTTLHPMHDYSEECMSSLQFANRCRNVQNQPRINYIGATEADKDKRIKRLTEEVGNLNRKLRQADGKSNERMLTILKQLGHQVMMLSDGTIETSDGKRIGLGGQVVTSSGAEGGKAGGRGQMLQPGEAEGGNGGWSGAWGEGGAGGGGGGEGGEYSGVVVARLQRTIETLKQEVAEAKKKANEKKLQLESLQKDMKLDRLRADEAVKRLREELRMSQAKGDKQAQKLRDYTKGLMAGHQQQLERLVADNHALLKQQFDYVAAMPGGLRVDSELLAQARVIEQQTRKEEAGKMEDRIRAMAQGKDSQMENLRQQYEYWLKKKSDQIEAFVQEFNKYRARKREELAGQASELLVLHDYAVMLKTLLDRVEHGRYPAVRRRPLPQEPPHKGGGVRVVLEIPKTDKPPKEILTDPTALKVTRKLLERRQRETLTLQKVQHQATQALCRTAKLNECAAEEDMQSILRKYTDAPSRDHHHHHREAAPDHQNADGSPAGENAIGGQHDHQGGGRVGAVAGSPVRVFLTTAGGASTSAPGAGPQQQQSSATAAAAVAKGGSLIEHSDNSSSESSYPSHHLQQQQYMAVGRGEDGEGRKQQQQLRRPQSAQPAIATRAVGEKGAAQPDAQQVRGQEEEEATRRESLPQPVRTAGDKHHQSRGSGGRRDLIKDVTAAVNNSNRLRPQSAPLRKPSTDQAARGGGGAQQHQQQEAVLAEQAGMWEGLEEEDPSLEEAAASHSYQQQHQQHQQGPVSVVAAVGSEPRSHVRQVESRAIFSDYDDDDGPGNGDEYEGNRGSDSPLLDHQQEPQAPSPSYLLAEAAAKAARPAAQGTPGWGEQAAYSAGQQLWGISMMELKHRRESADSFGQVSASDGSGGGGQGGGERRPTSEAGGGGSSLYKDYDDDDEPAELEPTEQYQDVLDCLPQQPQRQQALQQGSPPKHHQARHGSAGSNRAWTPGGSGQQHQHHRGSGSLKASSSSWSSLLLAVDPEHLSTEALKRLVAQCQQHVAATKSSSPPPPQGKQGYIRAHGGTLEEQVLSYQAQVRDQNKRYLELRCSYESLQRQLEKYKKHHHHHGSNPATSSSSSSSKKQQQQAGTGRGPPLDGGPSLSDLRASERFKKRPVSATIRTTGF